jgi:hypothetical protein
LPPPKSQSAIIGRGGGGTTYLKYSLEDDEVSDMRTEGKLDAKYIESSTQKHSLSKAHEDGLFSPIPKEQTVSLFSDHKDPLTATLSQDLIPSN